MAAEADAMAEVGSAVEWVQWAHACPTLHAWLGLVFGVVDPSPALPCAARLFWTVLSDRQRREALAWLCLAFVMNHTPSASTWAAAHSSSLGVEEAHAPVRWQRIWLQQVMSHTPLGSNHDYPARLVWVLLGAHMHAV